MFTKADVLAHLGVGEQAQRTCQESVPAFEHLLGAVRAGPLATLETRQQQSVRQSLSVRVGDLWIVGLRKQLAAPESRHLRQDGVGARERRQNVLAQQPAERRQQLGQRFGRRGRLRFEAQELAQQAVERRGVMSVGFVPRGTRRDVRSGSVERPLAAVGVEQIGQRAELLPLRLVGAFQQLGARALAGRLELDVTRQQPIDQYAHVRARREVDHAHLAGALHAPAEGATGLAQQGLDRPFELILGLCGEPFGRDVAHGLSERVEGVDEGGHQVGIPPALFTKRPDGARFWAAPSDRRASRTCVARPVQSARAASSSCSQAALEASLGMRQSPRGDRLTEPTFGPSGITERLNCWSKKRSRNTRSTRANSLRG